MLAWSNIGFIVTLFLFGYNTSRTSLFSVSLCWSNYFTCFISLLSVVSISVLLLWLNMIAASPAYITIMDCWAQCGRSLTYWLNINGCGIEPCGQSCDIPIILECIMYHYNLCSAYKVDSHPITLCSIYSILFQLWFTVFSLLWDHSKLA